LLTLLFIAALVVFLAFPQKLADSWPAIVGRMPRDPVKAAFTILDRAPVIDGHIDLPVVLRYYYANNASAIDLESHNHTLEGQVDIPRLRTGKVGGFFWSIYVECPEPLEEGMNHLKANWLVRDTLEQIDVSRQLMDKYPETFQFARSSDDIISTIQAGKIASLLGIEGGHQLGNSIAVLRQYYDLGVRYVTLTHTCNNAFADSCGHRGGITVPEHGGLSSLGYALIDEMNRLGVLVDLSHTSDDTAEQALRYSQAPVIWSHSSARGVHHVARNVPDSILSLIGTKEGRDAVVMVSFSPDSIADKGEADLEAVADHVEHIAKVAGKEHVGIGSDFDGILDTPTGLEDVSKYPTLIAELYKRGWNQYDLAGLTGGNLLRILKGAEKVASRLQAGGAVPSYVVYHKRKDIGRGRKKGLVEDEL